METIRDRGGALALALTPIAIGLGRFVSLYIAPGDDLWYQYRSISLYPSDLLVAIVVAAWFLGAPRGVARLARRPTLPVALGIAALALATLASAPTALEPRLALGVTAQLVLLATFAVAVADVAPASWRWLERGLTVAVGLQAALAIWQALSQSTGPAGALFNGWPSELAVRDPGASVAALPGADRWLRAYGSFPHPNILGTFLVITLVTLASGWDRLTRWRAIVVGVALVALALSFSRTAWLSVAIAAPVWLVARYGPRVGLAELVRQARARPLLIAVLAVGFVIVGARLARLDAFTEQQSFAQRQLNDQAGWSLVARGAPVGAGSVVLAEQSVALGVRIGEPPHNTLLLALVELGPLGIVAWLALLAGPLAVAWGRRADRRARAIGLAALAALLPFLWLDHYLWTQPTGRTLLVWALAIPIALASAPRPAPSRP